MHFMSWQLVTLFLEPDFRYTLAGYPSLLHLTDLVIVVEMHGQRVNPKTNADGEIDENFWAQAAADQPAGRLGESANEGKLSHPGILGP